jgi:hypothetical protein
MKKLVFLLATMFFSKGLFAQCDIAQKNVSLSSASIAVGQTSDIKFSISNDGAGSCAYSVGAVRVVMSMPGKVFSFQSLVTPAAGAYFNWTYNATKRVLMGINHTVMPVNAIEKDVTVRVLGGAAGKALSNLNLGITDGSDNASIANDPSTITVEVTSSPLPVRLISFAGKATPKGNELNWRTSSEQNFSHYEIEKSANAKIFVKIGTVKGTKNTKETLTYSYLDANGSGMLPGANATNQSTNSGYYRLRMVDLDGTSAYSKIVFLENDLKQSTVGEFYPNPIVGNEVQITINSNDNLDWVITSVDIAGRLLTNENKTLVKGENKLKLKLGSSSSGEIIYKFANADSEFSRKLFKR